MGPHLALNTVIAVLVVKKSPAKAGDVRDAGSVPRLGRSPGGGPGNPLQCSCLENPMDRGAWRAIVHGVAELEMTEATWDIYTSNSNFST